METQEQTQEPQTEEAPQELEPKEEPSNTAFETWVFNESALEFTDPFEDFQ